MEAGMNFNSLTKLIQEAMNKAMIFLSHRVVRRGKKDSNSLSNNLSVSPVNYSLKPKSCGTIVFCRASIV
ncbi:MAG: hypothetical protein D6820_07155 [Lentisphaerae bacterium]|nr:MAG: hypothetical protein D6820_07155 [Lentisphaerota bacterium]